MALTHYAQEKEDVKLVIQESFKHLTRFEMLVLNTRLILFQSFNDHSALSLAKARCIHGRIREEDEHDDSPC